MSGAARRPRFRLWQRGTCAFLWNRRRRLAVSGPTEAASREECPNECAGDCNLASLPRSASQPQNLAENLFRTRRQTSALAAPLGAEDQAAQANEDASPTKWHLAHTSWFFETFVLQPFLPGYRTFDERFNYCFNSYYEAQGARQPRAQRGLLTRPTCSEVRDYRAHVDDALQKLFAGSLAGR